MGLLTSVEAAASRMSERNRHTLLRWLGAWLLAMIALCVAISTRYFDTAQLEASIPALGFRFAMLTGHFAVLSSILLSPALLLAIVWPRPRWVIAVAVAISSSVALALLIDTQVYALYRFHINRGVMNLLLGGAARETFIFPTATYAEAAAIAGVVVMTVATTAVLLWRKMRNSRANAKVMRAATASILACIVAFHVVHIWADAVAYEPILEQTSILPARYAATAKRFLRAQGIEVRPARMLGASAPDRSALAYPLLPLECNALPHTPNIVFIVIDSWRFDEMNDRVTPRIADFAQVTSQFLDHHSGGNATRIGIFSLLYSIPGTYWHSMLNEQRGPIFIDELQRRRYDIQVFRSAPIFSPEFDRTVFAQVPLTRRRSDGDGPADWDRDLTNDFLTYLQRPAAPFLAFLFYDSPHSFEIPANYELKFLPSAPHVNYLRLGSDTDVTSLLNRYRNSLHYVDGLVGEVLATLRARGLLDSTIVVITGDHGQEFNDTGRNYWGHASNFTRYQTGVPMLLYVPGRNSEIARYRTSHFDVVPTLLRDHFGCTSAFSTFSVGRSLFDPANRHPLVLSEYADFAILQSDRIAVVREQGMKVFAPDYSELDHTLDPRIARAALEQTTRFLKAAGWRERASDEPPQMTASVTNREDTSGSAR
jgi:uncharacterized protein